MALYTDEIHTIIHSDPIASKYFVGVYPSDRIPTLNSLPAGVVLNLDSSQESGSHWVAAWVNSNGTAVYFDSYGLPPLKRSIISFLDEFEWEINTKRFQHFTSQDCGYYTILFVILSSRGFSLPSIQYLFYEQEGKINDQLVKDYIKFFTGWKSIKGLLKRKTESHSTTDCHHGAVKFKVLRHRRPNKP